MDASRVRRINLLECLADEHAAVPEPPEAAIDWSEEEIRAYFISGGVAVPNAVLTLREAEERWPKPASDSDVFKRWFPGLRLSKTAVEGCKLRVLCLHNAGSAEDLFTSEGTGARRQASPLLEWCRANGAEVLAPQLPGRGGRAKEPFLRSAREIADALLPLLAVRLVEAPYVVIGHSMGTWVAYETLSLLREAGLPMPRHVFFSCFPAPDLSVSERPWRMNAELDETAFKDECRGWDVSDIVFGPALWPQYQGIMRADFTIFDSYTTKRTAEPPLDFPITAFWADRDRRVTHAMVDGWRRITRGSFELQRVDGNHLFPLDSAGKKAWLERIVKQITVDFA